MTAPLPRWLAFGRDTEGAAAVEMALWAFVLAIPLLNVTELGFYMYRKMQVEEAAQVTAQMAWKTCDPALNRTPATTNCGSLGSVTTAAVGSTSLLGNVTIQSGYPTEGYYCPDASNVLQLVGPVTSARPANCSSSGYPAGIPGDYLQVKVNYTYTPVFQGATVGSLLPSPITKTAWMRMD